MAIGPEAILENDAGHADGVEPARDIVAFVVHGMPGVAAAWADDDGGARSLVGGRQVEPLPVLTEPQPPEPQLPEPQPPEPHTSSSSSAASAGTAKSRRLTRNWWRSASHSRSSRGSASAALR